MSIPKSRGRFIAFEGGEGAGKSTQIQIMQRWLSQSGWQDWLQHAMKLEQNAVMVTREPGGTILGKRLRQLLLDSALTEKEEISDTAELLLYAADRAQHVHKMLIPAIAQGALVLCDRFTDSTVAYQGYGRGIDPGLISQLNRIATAGLESDLTFWLDLDVQQGLQRTRQRTTESLAGKDRMESAELVFHQRVHQGFKALAQVNPKIVRIDAGQSEDSVAQQIQSILGKKLHQWYPQRSSHS